MGFIQNIKNSLLVRNAVQEHLGANRDVWLQGGYSHDGLFNSNNDKAGKYDNFYENSNRIITGAVKYPFYYTKNNEIIDPKLGNFAYYLANPNDDYPQLKVLEQIYSELITHGKSELFLWRKDGNDETRYFDKGKLYPEDSFRGFTLVSGYDKNRFTKADKDNIVRITLGASQANVFMGHSPSQAAMSWRKMQDEMGLHSTSFAKNSGMPIGQWVITATNPEVYKGLRAKLEKRMIGAKNSGKQLFVYKPSEESQAQIHWQQFTSQEVQDYTKQLEFADKKMDKAFGVPGTIKGSNDGENYATASVSKQNFVEWTISPTVNSLSAQLEFAIAKRFDIKGSIKVDVEIPELADESLVKIRATQLQVNLFDSKRVEGYTAESIVKAFALPERLLLLEKEEDTETSQNKAKKRHNTASNEFTPAERASIEQAFREVVRSYTMSILAGELSDEVETAFKTQMASTFSESFVGIYDRTKEEVTEAILDELQVIDASILDLTDEELATAVADYNKRVDNFIVTYTKGVQELTGDTLEVKSRKAISHIDRVVVSETEHSRIVSELRSWTKATEEFPVRVWKTWNAKADACDLCQDLHDITIDVTDLFVDNASDEIYEVQGGGMHPSCRCYCRFEMERRTDESN